MNTIEKRKIETVINADIAQHISAYKGRRNSEREAIKEKLEKKAPAEILALLTIAKNATATADKAVADAKKLGWDIKTYNGGSVSIISTWSYANGTSRYTPQAKELLDFEAQTDANVKKLEQIGRNYTLKIYAGGQEMQDLMDSFTKELAKIIN
jgi:hypothetical protein